VLRRLAEVDPTNGVAATEPALPPWTQDRSPLGDYSRVIIITTPGFRGPSDKCSIADQVE